jgi:uncharacterized protein YndB with AHSA1/START domain
MTSTAPSQRPQRSVTITRVINAPRARVFDAWTDARKMAQWWGPKHFTNPRCEIDARPGGAIYILMTAPDGTEYPMRGTFREVVSPERLVFTSVAEDSEGNALLEATTTVTFEDQDGKTKLTVAAHALGISPLSPQMLAGMEPGWMQTIDRLEEMFG